MKSALKLALLALLVACAGAFGFVAMAFVSVHGGDIQAMHELVHLYQYQKQQAQKPAGEQAK